MRYRSILVHVARTPAHEAAIGVAAGLAAEEEALLIGLSAGFPAVPPVADGMSAMVVAEVIEDERTQMLDAQRDAEQRFRRLAAAAPRVEWRAIEAGVTAALVTEGRAADLIVLPRMPENAEPDVLPPADPGDVLMQAGRPLLLPGTGMAELPRRPALLAWKDAQPSRRALADSLPLLRRAERVVVLGVDDAEDGPERLQAVLGDVVAQLGRHDIKAEARFSAMAPAGAAEEILSIAAETGAGLVVAGGYGRSPLREWVFGGVTRTLLMPHGVACLLSH